MNTTANSTRSGGKLGPRLAIIAVVLICTVVTVVAASFLTGGVYGEEFSPDTFDRRTFQYYEIPMLGVQIWPIRRKPKANDLGVYLAARPYITLSGAKTPRWDLVHGTRGSRRVHEGDARFWCAYVDAADVNGQSKWVAWSKANPQQAKILWPVVATLIDKQYYMLIPELIELAAGSDDPKRLQASINAQLAREFRFLADTQQTLERHELAVELYTESLGYDPADAKSLQGRAASWKALGDSAKAAADLKTAADIPQKAEKEEAEAP